MANIDNAHGCNPHAPFYGLVEFDQDASDGTAIFMGDVVDIKTNGNISPAAAGSLLIEGVSNSYSAASTANTVRVYNDPHQVYSIQTDSSTAAIITNYGEIADHSAGAGSTVTKKSGHELNLASLSDTNGGFNIRSLYPQVGNANGETHAEYFVVFNEHIFQQAGGAS
jgi:hypothetical protein